MVADGLEIGTFVLRVVDGWESEVGDVVAGDRLGWVRRDEATRYSVIACLPTIQMLSNAWSP